MKKLFTFFAIGALCLSTALVGCGSGADNSTKATDTSGAQRPKDSAAEKKADEEGKSRTTAAGGEAKSDTPPE